MALSSSGANFRYVEVKQTTVPMQRITAQTSSVTPGRAQVHQRQEPDAAVRAALIPGEKVSQCTRSRSLLLSPPYIRLPASTGNFQILAKQTTCVTDENRRKLGGRNLNVQNTSP